VCRCPADAGQFQSGGKLPTVASLTGSFALARERPPSGAQCRWGANRGARSLSGVPDVVAASGRLALWSHLAGQAVASPGGGRDPHSVARAWPQQFAPHQLQSGTPVPPGTARITGISDTAGTLCQGLSRRTRPAACPGCVSEHVPIPARQPVDLRSAASRVEEQPFSGAPRLTGWS
jgi:hypothetical protein